VIKGDKVYVRFNPLERILHVMLIYSFTILVLTGMPLKFFNTGWARTLMALLGGVETAGYLHRVAALIMVLMFGIHVFSLFKNFIRKIKTFKNPETGKYSVKVFIQYLFRPDSIIPSWKDVTDFWNHQKWFFGKGEKPKFDRWTYWEKFDYFAVFWGMVIIGLSGVVMWTPGFFTKVFPGWIINVALIIHIYYALLAAGFIFTFHFFNVHFRIEKFPMDTIIFSGRMSHAELVEEREAWMERLEKEGKLDELKLKDTSASWEPIFKSFGFLAFGTGIVLAIAIFVTMFIRLLQ
jgi:cytochrome b subunit of formate dehydrogenase